MTASPTLMVSVSGIRGHVGTDLTPELVARHAAALGSWAVSQGKPLVVMGRDARTSGPMFTAAAVSGFMSVGVDVIDLGVVPTPTVQMAVEHHHAGAGLIITASHNPIEWNALKFVGPDGVFLDAEAGATVRALAEKGPPRRGWEGLGNIRGDAQALARHYEEIFKLPYINVSLIRARRFRVALDCVRGAGGRAIPPLLEHLGCEVFGINLETDGRFPRPPEPLPENLKELGKVVRDNHCDIGMAVDPDVDRLALVDENGEAIGEDYTLAFAVRAVLAHLGQGGHGGHGGPSHGADRPDRHDRHDRPVVVVNLSTSLVVEDAAGDFGARFVRAPVGEANVARAMHQLGAEVAQPDPELLLRLRDRRDRRQHAGGLAVLPQHLEDRHFLVLAARHRDVHAARDGPPGLREALLDRVGDDDLAGLGLARHSVRGMHGDAEDVARLEHDRPEMAADADRDLLALHLEVRVARDRRLHLDRRVDRRVAVAERRHDLVAHRLDDGAAVLLGRPAHDVDADRDLVARSDVAQDLEQAGAADDVGEEDREFLVLPH